MQENKNIIFKTLRLTTLFLGVFLTTMFAFVSGKALTFQFMGSASVWGIELLFISLIVFLAYVLTIFAKKFKSLALIASLVGLSALFLLSLNSIISPLDLWFKVPSLTLLWLLLKYTFLPFLGLFITIFAIEKDKEAGGIIALSVLLCLILYPFMYEKSITLTQSITLFVFAYGFMAILNALLLFNKEEREDVKEEFSKNLPDILKPVGIGALLGALLIGYTNNLTFNLLSIPAIWAFALFAFGLGGYLAYKKSNWTQKRHALVAVWISLLMVTIFRMRTFTYLENPCLNTILTLFSLFAFSWFLWSEVLNKESRNKAFWALILLGLFAGMVFQNALIPLLSKIYIDYIVLNFILYSFAFFIFCTSFVRGKNFGEETIKKALMTMSLSIIVVFAFFVQENTPYLELRTRNFWGINSVVTNRANGTREFYSDQKIVSMQDYGSKTLDYTMNPVGFYGASSGFYYVFEGMKNWETTKNRPLLIAKIGMEGGGINGYLSDNDKVIYYDVNPQAKDLADKFAYMKLSQGEVEFRPGNPRINLKNEKTKFDIIFVDLAVLQGDNAYLITNEALSLYKRKLKRDGVIIFNTTNKNLNYKKVLAKYVQDNNLRYSYFVVRYPEKYIDNFDNTSFIIFGKRNKIYKRFEKFTLKKGGVEAFDSVNAIKTMRREFNDNNSSILPLFRFAIDK